MSDALALWAERVRAAPFHRLLGFELVALDAKAGSASVRMPRRPEFNRSDSEAGIHGGAIASLIDIAGDYALAVLVGGGVPTIDLRIDYLRPAIDTALIAVAHVVKSGRMIAIVDIAVRDEAGKLVAIGRGCYATKPG